MATTETTADFDLAARVRPFSIGPLVVDPPVLQAPMAGFTNYAFRQIVRQFGGAGLQATEMVHAKGFLWMEQEEHEFPDRLWGVKEEPRPLAVQIWDNDPETLAAVGAKLAHEFRVSVVDINFGCPVKTVTQKAHSGSYLLRYPDRMFRDHRARRAGLRPDAGNGQDSAGLHARYDQCDRSGPGGRSGRCLGAYGSWPHGPGLFQGFGRLGPHRRDQAPLEADSADRQRRPRFAQGGDRGVSPLPGQRRDDCPGGAHKPWLFQQVHAALRGRPIPPDPTLDEERQLMLDHYGLVCDRFGEAKGTILMRKYACCYAQGRYGARQFRTQVTHASNRAEFYAVVEEHFPREGAPVGDPSHAT